NPPVGTGWLHEIKHDGFRMLVRRNAAGVRLFTRKGHDWTGRFPLIARAALSLKAVSCLIDGEAVACEDNGLPVFDRLRYRRDDQRDELAAASLDHLVGTREERRQAASSLLWRISRRPLGPGGPWGPAGPAGPATPGSPFSPFGPAAPGGPGGPAGPRNQSQPPSPSVMTKTDSNSIFCITHPSHFPKLVRPRACVKFR